jgi:hypothetical protein
MSGLGFKTFTAGDVLTASDVNGYLMSQAVMVFDDATARNTALPSPTEGMTVYEKNLNLYAVYNGSAWIYEGRFESYTPTFTGFTLGDGTASFKYATFGKLVVLRANITFGSTSAVTAVSPNSFEYSLPVTAQGVPSVQSSTSGGQLLDASTASRVPIVASPNTTTTGTVFWIESLVAVSYFNAFSTTTSPFALAASDEFRFSIAYEAA